MILDIIVCALFFICAFGGLRHGFGYTLIHTLGWFIAIAVSFVGTSHARIYLLKDIDFLSAFLPEDSAISPFVSSLTGDIVNYTATIFTSCIIFIVLFLIIKAVLSLFLVLFTTNNRHSFSGKINSFLGLILGFLKGFVVVSVFLFAVAPVLEVATPDLIPGFEQQLSNSVVAKPLYDANILPLLIEGFTA